MFPKSPPLDARSKELRRLVIDGLDGGGRGHIGSSMSLIEIFRVLYDDVLKHRPDEPLWPDRDRCILSKGHGCLAIYVLLASHGYFPTQELRTFCRFPSFLGGHPERGKVPGVEASTGALGHGLSIGVGTALALRIQKRDSRVFVIMGDGEINEGSVWEAAMSAAKHDLSNLTAVIDYNKIQSYGRTSEVLELEPLLDKWRAFGFEARECDGHDVGALRDLLSNPLSESKPGLILAHTVKGKGIPFAENDPTWHHKSRLSPEQIETLYAALSEEG
ncbi:MAG: transketolase [Rhodospirillales bacterium]|nr:transketolase [Rhodospirillales bacterium]MBO6787727.1 transketolase [Rhodospirillales bacterium]